MREYNLGLSPKRRRKKNNRKPNPKLKAMNFDNDPHGLGWLELQLAQKLAKLQSKYLQPPEKPTCIEQNIHKYTTSCRILVCNVYILFDICGTIQMEDVPFNVSTHRSTPKGGEKKVNFHEFPELRNRRRWYWGELEEVCASASKCRRQETTSGL